MPTTDAHTNMGRPTYEAPTNKRNTHKQTPGGAVRLAYGAMRLFSFLYCFLRAAAPQKGDSSLAQREARAEFFSPYPLAIEAQYKLLLLLFSPLPLIVLEAAMHQSA